MSLNLKPVAGTANRVIVEPAAAEEKQHQEFIFQIQLKKNHLKAL